MNYASRVARRESNLTPEHRVGRLKHYGFWVALAIAVAAIVVGVLLGVQL